MTRIQNANTTPMVDSLSQVVTGNDVVEGIDNRAPLKQTNTFEHEPQQQSQSDLVPAELEAKQQAHIEYDQNASSHQGAIGIYLANQHAEQRESISQMVGIDTYA
ncbi:hypothetical protein [Shewanella waksmanii]|uniref:hypothetical protein n=1 Tax=Shewanella waksmanii TaxID=213783 RepID=UPI0037352136